MRKLLLLLLFLVVVVVVGLLVAPNYIPADVYKGRIAEAASKATGRDVSIGGDVRFSFMPRFEVVAGDVTVGNVAGGQADHLARIGELGIGIEIWPLLDRTIRVDRFVLADADINLEVDGSGQGNWQFETRQETGDAVADATAEAEGAPESVGRFTLADVSFNDVRLANSRLTVRDRSGQVEIYDDINVALTLAGLDSPLTADGRFKYKDESIELKATVAAPRALLDGGDTDVAVDLGGSLAEGSFDGKATIAPDKPLVFAGAVNMDVPSLRRLAEIGGQPLTSGSGFGPLALKGTMRGDAAGYAVDNAQVSLDGMTGSGNFTLTTARAVPKLTGTLAVDMLDVNVYMADATVPGPSRSGEGGGGGGRSGESDAGSAQTAWSTEPIDLSGLRAFDADLDLTAEKVFFRDIILNRSNIKLTVVDGILNATLQELSLYEGSGKGSLMVDARRQTPAIQSEFSIDALRALPFLQDALGFDRLAGIGDLSYSLNTQGRNQRQLVSNLNGTTTIKFFDGELRGVNLVSLANAVQTAFGRGSTNEESGQENVGQGERTEFPELGATFVVRDGQMTSQDFQLLNPLLQVLGGGAVDLVAQRVKFNLQPKLLTSAAGADSQGVVVPLIVEGRWDNLSYRPDFANLLMGVLKPALPGQESTGDPLQDLLRGAIGSPTRDETEETEATVKPDKPRRAKNKTQRQQQSKAASETPAQTDEETPGEVAGEETAETAPSPEAADEAPPEPEEEVPQWVEETPESSPAEPPSSTSEDTEDDSAASESADESPDWSVPQASDPAADETADDSDTPQTPEQIILDILGGGEENE